MFVIGTAGHVDHGKSALVRALTGIDPDRLQEEKDRGMTIDLGFAWLEMADGAEVSIVDVPGHERFIKNMLAGVGGIDLALLIVAADEGVMPQTREHLAILDLLGVTRGVLVVTKIDLVDQDWLDLVTAEVEEAVKGTTLEGSPVVPCSALTRQGLDQLMGVIEKRLQETDARRDLGRPRLPIDRVFTVSGFGTVVTGTLIDGVMSLGQDVEVVPATVGGHLTSLRSRVRGLQSHRARVEQAHPGSRTAANLAGLDPGELSRGQVVTTPGWLLPSEAVDVRLRALSSLSRPLRHNLNVTFHSLASEAPARVRLLEIDELAPGEEAWAQIRLYKPLALLRGDRFIIRDPNQTLGGGTVVETQAKRHARKRPAVIAALSRQQLGDASEAVYSAVAAGEPVELRTALLRTDLSPAETASAVERLLKDGRIVTLGEGEGRLAMTAQGFDKLSSRAKSAVGDYLARNPLRRGLSKEELRSRLDLPPRSFNLLLDAFLAREDLADAGHSVSTPGWQPQLSPALQRAADVFLAAAAAQPFTPPQEQRPPDDVVAYLIESGDLVDCGGTLFTRKAFEEMTRRVLQLLREKGSATMADVRDLLASSRRYVQPFLEELDSRRITIRRGDERVLRGE